MESLIVDETTGAYKIRELEVSITTKCHLRCNNCGFYIPNQPNPTISENVIDELVLSLSYLEKLKIRIGSLAILGGEPTAAPDLLERSVLAFSQFKNIESIEVVTHGLTPQGLSKKVLNGITKLTISVYFNNQILLDLWQSYLQQIAPHVWLSFRTDKEWDKWIGSETVNDLKAQVMFDQCWYRKHCTSIERNRLFLCSRISKLSKDDEGLLLSEKTGLKDIKNYLNRNQFLSSCKTCIPMMGLPTVPAGKQPDSRIEKMIPKAISYLKEQLDQ